MAQRLGDYADVLELLARIHDREADAGLIDGLRENNVCDWLDDVLASPESHGATANLRDALAALPDSLAEDDLDKLAVVYTDMYLTHGFGISPSGSVWLTEDNLERQGPMFDVREWYRRYDLAAPEWRTRPDDHIVHQLQFMAYLLEHPSTSSACQDLADFLDAGLRKWIPDYAARVEQRVSEPFYRAVAQLTLAIVNEIRHELQVEFDIPLPVKKPDKKSRFEIPVQVHQPYMPGVAKSW